LIEFGNKTSRYYDPEKKEKIENTKLFLYPGFQTCFNMYEGGLYLRVDVSNKVVRTETVLALINQIYESNASKSKDEKRKLVCDALVGKTVCAVYGNYRYWKVEDLLFDKDCHNFTLSEEDQSDTYTLYQYYKDKYNMIINYPKQPLIVCNQKKKRPAYLIPEFCIMTGVPEELSDYIRKQVSDKCLK